MNKLQSIILSCFLLLSSCMTPGDAALFVTPGAFVVANQVIAKSEDKSKTTKTIHEIANNIDIGAEFLETGTLTREQFILLVAQTKAPLEIAYLVNYIFELYEAKVTQVPTDKLQASINILKQLAQGLRDAADLADTKSNK